MRLISAIAALALSTSAVMAADVSPLAPGKPAGVKQAQDVGIGDNTMLYIALGAAVIAGIAVAASQDDNAAPTPAPTTTTTTTTTV